MTFSLRGFAWHRLCGNTPSCWAVFHVFPKKFHLYLCAYTHTGYWITIWRKWKSRASEKNTGRSFPFLFACPDVDICSPQLSASLPPGCNYGPGVSLHRTSYIGDGHAVPPTSFSFYACVFTCQIDCLCALLRFWRLDLHFNFIATVASAQLPLFFFLQFSLGLIEP